MTKSVVSFSASYVSFLRISSGDRKAFFVGDLGKNEKFEIVVFYCFHPISGEYLSVKVCVTDVLHFKTEGVLSASAIISFALL
jgi:hypothetical protein